jgi:hypothetical protein
MIILCLKVTLSAKENSKIKFLIQEKHPRTLRKRKQIA